MKINLLNIFIDQIKPNDVFIKIKELLKGSESAFIETINPEIVLMSVKDLVLKENINNASLVIPDGFGLTLMSLLLMQKRLYRFPGADIVLKILELAKIQKIKIFVLLKENSLTKPIDILNYAKENGIEQNICSSVVFANNLKENNYLLDVDLINEINSFAPDIWFCAIGAPDQEKVISANLKLLSSVKIAMSVGGAFDFVSGKIKRAPKFFRKLGLEWLYRFSQEPRYRAKRIFRAVIVFPLWAIIVKFEKMLKIK